MGDDLGTVMVGCRGHARVVADALRERVVGHPARAREPDSSTELLGRRFGSDARVLAELGHQFAIGGPARAIEHHAAAPTT
jgi:hypothetical protein